MIHVLIIFWRNFSRCLTSFFSSSLRFFPHQVVPLPLVHFSQGPDRRFRRFRRDDTDGKIPTAVCAASRRSTTRSTTRRLYFSSREEVKKQLPKRKFSAPTRFFFRCGGKIGGKFGGAVGLDAGEPFCYFYVRSLRRIFGSSEPLWHSGARHGAGSSGGGSSLGRGAPQWRESAAAAPIPAKGDGRRAGEKEAFLQRQRPPVSQRPSQALDVLVPFRFVSWLKKWFSYEKKDSEAIQSERINTKILFQMGNSETKSGWKVDACEAEVKFDSLDLNKSDEAHEQN